MISAEYLVVLLIGKPNLRLVDVRIPQMEPNQHGEKATSREGCHDPNKVHHTDSLVIERQRPAQKTCCESQVIIFLARLDSWGWHCHWLSNNTHVLVPVINIGLYSIGSKLLFRRFSCL